MQCCSCLADASCMLSKRQGKHKPERLSVYVYVQATSTMVGIAHSC